MLIHIKRDAEVFGPYSIEEAREYLSVGRLSLSDFAQLPGSTEWIPLASVPGVKSVPPPPVVPKTECVQFASPPTSSPQQKKRSDDLVSWLVIRDVLIVLGLQTGGVGIVILSAGFARESPPVESNGAIGTFLGTVGFAISGSLCIGDRWEHLFKVATITTFAYWGFSLIFLHDMSTSRWLMSLAFVLLMMGLGGVLSYLFKRR
jgi:hypothetical protein